MWLIGIGTRRVRTVLAAAIAWRRSIATRWAVWSPVARALVAISRWAVTAGWAFSTHAPRTFVRIAARAIAWGRAFRTPSSAAFFAVTARAIIVGRTFRSPMATSFFTIVEQRTHFVTIATARTVKGISARRSVETSVG